MTKQERTPRQRRSKLNITQDAVVGIIRQTIDFDGLEAARREYEHMCVTYATFPGWPETAAEILELLAAEKKRLQEEELQRQEAERQASPSVYILNNNAVDRHTYSIPHVDQLNGYVERGAEIIHTKTGGTRK